MNLILYFICSYFIGNILSAHILAKLLHKGQIHEMGSGNPGARNAGRVYGKKAFVFTFLGDALKGGIVVIIGRLLDFSDIEQLIGVTLALIGHIKPILFKLKGGKGVSTFIGGVITFEPLLVIPIILAFLVTYPFTKSFTISGLGSLCILPIIIYYLHDSVSSMWMFIILTLVLISAHMNDLLARRKA
ncbi:glycerol-3-phosphate acyltransferase PlsY [Cytobacillus eiseniae]|uniref:Glycerol-3-phosphate acyltransferase n=1 Tax=Cytobacillus eiseniae TaxID=762947 RepID=A0ABS4RA03_9BACI|nr:glycerol-3-phosphate acyltransferase [Cytobacillus eiseniae]MBP2239728.1 glycerol-3-phosphate acyltransferase PlsY [Cytobacillus eiseniae]